MLHFSDKHKLILLVLVLEIIYIILAARIENKYCKIKCPKRNEKHTMCLYPPGPNNQTCKNYRFLTLTPSDKDNIVNIHNHIRSRVANGEEMVRNGIPLPTASNMMEMTWDDELAKIAQRWADQCRFQHDKCRNSERFHVGQNIARSTTRDKSYATSFVYQFYKELQIFLPKTIFGKYNSPNRFSKVGHYTQMIWATTKYIGCARISHRPANKNRIYQYVVCNYGPAGNVHKRNIYEIGIPCSKCPYGTKCSKIYPGLCTRH